MGSYLRKLAPGMSDENLERFATTLINTAEVILKRWEYDERLDRAQVKDRIEDKAIVYKVGTAGNIIGRIHPPGPKVDEVSVEGLIAAMGTDGKIPLYMMDALSNKWKGKDLKGMQRQLSEFRIELREDLAIKKTTEKKTEQSKIVIAPEMPPMDQREDIPYDWTVFGFLPRSREVMQDYIGKRTSGLAFKRLGSKRGILYERQVGNIAGKILPDWDREQIIQRRDINELIL